MSVRADREEYEREIQKRKQDTGTDAMSGSESPKVSEHKRRIAENQHEHLRQDLEEKARKN
jgi:hypothetical protein